jgi:hypothetical protein
VSDGLEGGSADVFIRAESTPAGTKVIDEPAGAPREREGLPREFRMRADRHYVDQLASRPGGQPVRIVAIDEIDAPEVYRESEIAPLVQSIRSHGILHPLLVRRHASRYSVIAGRRRLAAARVLRLGDVPCLLHQADDEQAASLAQADNVTVRLAHAPIGPALVADVRHAVARHLATVQSATNLLSSGAPPLGRSIVDVVKAHAWRAARLLDVADTLALTPARSTAERPLAAIVDQVMEGFRAESRLADFRLAAHVHDGAASVRLHEHDAVAALSGAVFSTLAVIDNTEHREPIVVTIEASAGTSVILDVAQSAVEMPGALARRFFDETSGDRPGGWCAVAAALAVRTIAERHGGRAHVETAAGSSIKIALPRRS